MLYFDHAASTPPYPEVIESVAATMQRYYANPSSIHKLGQTAEQLLNKARSVIAGTIGVHPEEIVFTSGGTESNNLGIKGAVAAYQNRGKHIVTTAIEHASVYECCKQLERAGYEVTYVMADENGRINPEDIEQAITDQTVLVSVMHVNNETGAIQPIETIGKLLKSHPRILFHVDAVQSVGKLPIFPKHWGIDLLSASAHKFHGPRGAGFLYVRENINILPLQAGGAQENGRRSGTEHVALIAGMAKALRMTTERLDSNQRHLNNLRERLVQNLNAIPGISVVGSKSMEDMSPYIIQLIVRGLKPEIIVHALEEEDIFISTRSACSSGEDKPSRILMAMGMSEEAASSGLRISLSADHTIQDINVLCEKLEHVIANLKALIGPTGGTG